MFLVTKLAEFVSYFIIITAIMDLLRGQWLYQYTGDVTLSQFSNFTSSNLISHFIIVLFIFLDHEQLYISNVSLFIRGAQKAMREFSFFFSKTKMSQVGV